MRPLFYITGGTLPADALCYVERQADRDLLDALLDAQFCYVLDTRQVGKSSLIERTARNLRERGVVVAKIDLTTTGKEVTAAQWYNGMLRQVADSLHAAGLPDCWDDLRGFWRDNAELGPMQRWVEALRSVVLAHSDANLVIFVDEIESVRSFDFTDEFFAGIRACYNRRVDEPALRRLSFCLAGSATPDELIHSVTSTPFNIGHAITLSDFTRGEAAVLAEGLADKSLLDRILYWTNGHPYLTQRLCAELTETTADVSKSSFVSSEHLNTRTPEHRIDALCERLFFSPEARKSEKNLAFVAKRILDSPLDRAGLLDLYGKVRRGNVVNDEKDAFQSTLRLSGVARARNGQLEVRNRIYERVFDPTWIRENMPYAEVRRQQTAYRRGLYRAGAMASVVVGIMGLLTLWAIRSQQQANRYRVKAEKAAGAERTLSALAEQQRKEAERAAYIADMNLIADAYKANDFARISELLDETKQEKYQTYRGFEWGYWNRVQRLHLLTLKEHTNTINTVSSSSDGTRIVPSSSNKTVKMSDVQTEWMSMSLNVPRLGAQAVAFSPDGQRIVTGGGDLFSRHVGYAEVWDAQTGQEILALQGHTDLVMSVAFSPDGRRIVTGSRGDKHKQSGTSGEAKVWDAQTGQELLALKGFNEGVSSVAFSPDGRRIVTGSNTAKVWDAENGREILTLNGHISSVGSVAFSPDGTRIVTGSEDKTARVWDAQTGREILVLQGHEGSVNSVAFSPDCQQIVTGSNDNTAKVWNARTGHEILTLVRRPVSVSVVAFSPDGRQILTGSAAYEDFEGCVGVWDAQTGREILELQGMDVRSVAFSPDGKRIAAGGWVGVVKVWFSDSNDWKVAMQDTNQASTHLRLARYLFGSRKYVEALAEFNSASRLHSAIWDATSLGELGEYEYRAGQIREAIKSNRSALEKDPTLTYVRLNLGLSYATLDDWLRAKKEYDQALKAVEKGDMPKDRILGEIINVEDALKKRDNPALEKALVYLQKAGGK